MNWMFDDIWPTGTWSVIDYYLKPKAAYYTLKREYAPFRGGGYFVTAGENISGTSSTIPIVNCA